MNLYLDGQPVGTPVDIGAAANLDYDNTVQLFVVGGLTNGASPNPLSTGLFNERLDEVVVWNQYFTPQMALDHYIDAFNNYKVRQDSVPPADIAAATFYGEFMQNALITLPTCNGAKFIYIDETTHPPTVNHPEWQLCNTTPGGIIQPNLAQGGHELKIWAKDEYDNVSAGYLKLDTTITGIAYQFPGVAYYTFDNNQNNIAQLFDIFSGHTALSFGADGGFAESGTKNEAYGFVRASNDYIERRYAYNLQPKNELSLSVLAKLVQNVDLQQTLAGTRMSGHGYDIEINNAANELRFNVETSGGTRTVGVSISSYTTGYHNVIGVYDGTTSKLYIDGEEVASVNHGSLAAIQYQCLGSFTMGAGATCNSGPVAGTHFNGVLDEVIVWDDALTAGTIFDFFNGQDKVPPEPVDVNPKDNQTTIGIPVARFNVTSCDDIAAVYVTLEQAAPLSDIANWQACSETGDLIKSPLLDNGVNQVYFWFKDAAGNVSLTRTQVAMTLDYDFTIPTRTGRSTTSTSTVPSPTT